MLALDMLCTRITHLVTAWMFLACSVTSSQQGALYHYRVWNSAPLSPSSRRLIGIKHFPEFSPSVCGMNTFISKQTV